MTTIGATMPAISVTDISIQKRTPITERFTTEFRAEFYNAWNHTQFAGDYNNGGIGLNFDPKNPNSGFGVITKAFDPRVFQLGLKVIFSTIAIFDRGPFCIGVNQNTEPAHCVVP